MEQEKVKGLFSLAEINVLRMWELPNQYWPEAYVEERKNSPWWLVKTPEGLIQIGWRKRVISIDWSDTNIKREITEDDVTKSETMVHAYGYGKALEYLTALARLFTTEYTKISTPDTIEGWTDATKILVHSHLYGESNLNFDFGGIRPKRQVCYHWCKSPGMVL